MTTWVTADQHYDHANIIKYCARPFGSVEEMNETLIAKHNEVVEDTDTVYMLGDVTLQPQPVFLAYMLRLKGKIHVLPGSHDERWLYTSPKAVSASGQVVIYEPPLKVISPMEIQVPGKQHRTCLVLCHYALRVWPMSHYGSYHAYGHSHGKLPGVGRSMDVGVDTNNFAPYSVKDLAERLNNA